MTDTASRPAATPTAGAAERSGRGWWRWPLAPGLLTGLLAALALVGTYLVAVHTAMGQSWDTRAMRAVAGRVSDSWPDQVLTAVSPGSVLLAGAGVCALAWAASAARGAVAAAATIGGTVVASQVLKEVLERPALGVEAAGNSLPSGHVAAVAGLAVALAACLPRVVGWLAWIGALAVASVVGAATIAAEWHRPSDVLASVLLAVAVCGIAQAVVRPWPRGT